MAVRHTVVLQDSSGEAQTGKDVKLYAYGATPGVDSPLGAYSDNGDGSYYITVSVSAKYSVAVEGALQDELTGIYIVADDLVTSSQFTGHTGSANPHSGSASSSALSDHTGASNPHSGSASSTDLSNLSAIVGTPNFDALKIINPTDDYAAALARLDNRAYVNSIRNSDTIGEQSRRMYIEFTYNGAFPGGVLGSFKYPNGISNEDLGFPLIRSGSITAMGVSWKTGSIAAGETVGIYPGVWGAGTPAVGIGIENADVSEGVKFAYFDIGTIDFNAGSRLACIYAKDTSATLIDVVVIIEITLQVL